MCKWCGTRYCKECGRGDFTGVMKSPDKCRKCFQKKCQGQRVEYVPRPPPQTKDKKAGSSRSKKSAKSKKSRGKKKSGKKKYRK
ncbi:cGMP-gated cation channel alpha-1-like [Huso huso]|uniref:cGMP-gated cation channel alpha-1-like n=1 Tax=Huso huso TaxID=61971 RepID=A0ABR1A0X2_HUSHU